jgi:hypothetical protein
MLQAADLMMGNARMVVERTTKWPKLDWKKLKVLFSHVWAAEQCAQITAKHLASVTGLPVSAFPFTVVRSTLTQSTACRREMFEPPDGNRTAREPLDARARKKGRTPRAKAGAIVCYDFH